MELKMNIFPELQKIRCIDCKVKSSIFNFLTEEQLQLIDQNKIHVHFNPGETIKKQGTYMSHVLSVNDGMAKLYLEGIEGRSTILRIVKPTHFIGGPGIYYDQRHHFTVTALTHSSVCFIDLKIFKQLLSVNPTFAEEFLKDFSKDVLSVYNRLILLTQKQMPGRMADALLYLHDEIFMSSKFPMLLSRYELADLSSMSRESGVKILREFQKEKIISICDNELEILQVDSLRKISHVG